MQSCFDWSLSMQGDPEADGMNKEDKRRIKRRIANRESTRRVRQKRQELMEELQAKVGVPRSFPE